MKKLFSISIVIILVLSPLSAVWRMDYYVDSGNNHQNYALYIADDGVFSNYNTKNSLAIVRIIAQVSYGAFPSISFDFRIEEFASGRVIGFNPDSNLLLRFKNDAGSIMSFNINTSIFTDYSITLDDRNSLDFYLFLKNSNKLDAEVTYEETRYYFSITSQGLEDVIGKLLKEKGRGLSNWRVLVAELSTSRTYVSVSKEFMLNSNGNDYGLSFAIIGYPLAWKGYPAISMYLLKYVSPFYYEEDVGIAGITFKVGRKKLVVKNTSTLPKFALYYRLGSDIKYSKLYALLDKGEWVDIELNFSVPHDPIKIKLESSKLREFITYPYSDEIMNQ